MGKSSDQMHSIVQQCIDMLHAQSLICRISKGKLAGEGMAFRERYKAAHQPSGELGAWLCEKRRQRNLNLREVEAGSGLSFGFLARLETGEYGNPTISTLAKIARFFDADVGHLARMAARDVEVDSPLNTRSSSCKKRSRKPLQRER